MLSHSFYPYFRDKYVDLMSLVFLHGYLRCLNLLKLAYLPSSTLLRLCRLLYYLARKFQIITAHTIRTRETEI